jgi:hypothetical protein
MNHERLIRYPIGIGRTPRTAATKPLDRRATASVTRPPGTRRICHRQNGILGATN